MATLIHPDGSEQGAQPTNSVYFTYDELRAIVGGSLETLPARDFKILFFHGESKGPRNMKAMELAGITIDPEIMQEEDYIHGDVLLCEQSELRTGQKRG
jgi:hypothetical protein